MAEKKKWKEIKPDRDDSDFPETWEFDEGKNSELVGTLVEVRENVGKNHSNVYTLELESGKRVSCWGCAILDSRLAEAEMGTEVRIVYLGKKDSKTSGSQYNDFRVFKLDIELEEGELEDEEIDEELDLSAETVAKDNEDVEPEEILEDLEDVELE